MTETETLWITDAELIRRSGVPEKVMRPVLHRMDADRRNGFPKKNPLYGNRRYWPAVQDYWAKQTGIKPQDSHRNTVNSARMAHG
jgi:hypothetical protein